MSNAPVRVVFIGGASRSGSTLLDRLLGAVPGCISLGEVHQLWQRGLRSNHLCGCGSPFLDCQFWSAVLERVGAVDVSAALELQREVASSRRLTALLWTSLEPRWQVRRQAYASALAAVYRAAIDVSGARLVIDSSKRPVHALVLRGRQDVSVTSVHLVRDSRAVAYSLSRVRRKPDVHDRNVLMTRLPPLASARGWVKANALMDTVGRSVGPFLRLRYEDVVLSSTPAVDRILRTAGETAPDLRSLLEAGTARLPIAHTVSGNPMRFRQGPVPLRLDEEWREGLSARDRRVVTALTAPLLLRYGYRL